MSSHLSGFLASVIWAGGAPLRLRLRLRWMVEKLFEDARERPMQENTGTPFGDLHCGRESLGNSLKKVRTDSTLVVDTVDSSSSGSAKSFCQVGPGFRRMLRRPRGVFLWI